MCQLQRPDTKIVPFGHDHIQEHAGYQQAGRPAPEPQTAEWVQKHAPQSLEQIVVAKKKVQEAQQWLEPFRNGTPHPAHARVLLLTGAAEKVEFAY